MKLNDQFTDSLVIGPPCMVKKIRTAYEVSLSCRGHQTVVLFASHAYVMPRIHATLQPAFDCHLSAA